MNNEIVKISAVREVQQMVHDLLYSSRGTPRMGMLSGPVGLGKTTSAQSACLAGDAVWLVMLPNPTPNWTFGDLAVELGAERGHNTRLNFERAVAAQRVAQRAVFVDNAELAVRQPDLLEWFRAYHDVTGAPVVFVATEQFPRAIQSLPQLASRVGQWIQFQPCDLRDMRMLASELCNAELGDDLLRHTLEATGGSVRGIRVALERIERLARRRAKRRITLADLPEKFEFVYSLKHPSQRDNEGAGETRQLAVVGSDASA